LFRSWDDTKGFDANFDHVLGGRFSTQSWMNEVRLTLRLRFSDSAGARALVILARGSLPLDEWRHCLLLEVASRERDYWEFAAWLYGEYLSGRFRVRAEDLVGFVNDSWERSRGKTTALTEYGAVRTARDLLRMARELGVLHGSGAVKEFGSISMADDTFLFVCHRIAEIEGTVSKVLSSPLWRAYLFDERAVEVTLLRLHQFHRLRYQVAGSLVELSLPCRSSIEFAARMVA
jgi:hypothetical protein